MEDGPDEAGTPVITVGGFSAGDFTVDHQQAVRRTTFVAGGDPDHQAQKNDGSANNKD